MGKKVEMKMLVGTSVELAGVPTGDGVVRANTDDMSLSIDNSGFKVMGGGSAGYNGWTPILSAVSDGDRIVHRIEDWTGGSGTKPQTGQYIGAAGLVSTAALGVDIRGRKGVDGEGGSGGYIPYPVNLFDETETVAGKEVSADGRILNQADSVITGNIPVGGKILFLSGFPVHTTGYSNRYYFFYDENNSPIMPVGTMSRSETTLWILVPENAKYFVMSISQRAGTSGIDFNAIRIYGNSPQRTRGKSLLVFGDSISATSTFDDDGTNYVGEKTTNWPTYTVPMLELSGVTNYSKSGAAYKDSIGAGMLRISHQITRAIENGVTGDIIVVSAGTNDAAVNVGSYATAMGKATLAELDRNNLYEAVRWAFWTLRLNYPNAVFFAATPIQRAIREPVTELSNAIKDMAKRYNFFVIDAEYESGIARDFEVQSGSGRYLSDGIHPNVYGKRQMALLYSREIRQRFF